MIIVDIDNLDGYRFAIAKHTFLTTYSNYKLLKDYKNTNCMLVEHNKDTFIVSLLGKPTIKLGKYKNVIFKQTNSKQTNELLSSNFNELFSSLMDELLLNPNEKESRLEVVNSSLFDGIVVNINKNEERYSDHVFKHYSPNSFAGGQDLYNRVLGEISFVHPDTFNDPFDCQCAYQKGSITDKFRVFCSIPYHDNILMWSYYSVDHKGYCFEYGKKDIINAMYATGLSGIGIVGKIRYRTKRPIYNPRIKPVVSYSDLKFYIEATFSKFKRWSHEDEYRFVIISDSVVNASMFYPITVPVYKVYVGSKGNTNPLIHGPKIIYPVQLKLSISDYKLK